MTQYLLAGLTAIVLLGVGAQWIAWRLRLPSLLILILIGVLAGPMTGLLNPDAVFGEILSPLVGLAIAVILFEESLSFRFTDVERQDSVVRALVFVGTLVSWVLGSYFASSLVGLPFPLALLLGAILAVSGPTVIASLLRDIRLKGQLGVLLRNEGIGIEPVGVTLAVLILGGIHSSEESGSALMGLFGVLETALIGGGLGTLGALALLGLLRSARLPDELEGPSVFATVVAAYTLANYMQPASGLLASTVLGMILANQRVVRISPLLDLHENFRLIALSTLFIVLSARLDIAFLSEFSWPGFLFLLALVFIVRPAAVFVATVRSQLPIRERIFLAAVAPRGFVAAGLSSLFSLQLLEEGYFQAERLTFLTFFVILGAGAIYGVVIPFLARHLLLTEDTPRGVLLLGAHDWARGLAREIQASGIRVLTVDRNPYHVTAAQRENIPARSGNIFSSQMMEGLALEGFGTFLALTQNDEVNALATTHFSEYFGKDRVYQLRNHAHTEEPSAPRSKAQLLFDTSVTYAEIEQRVSQGAVVRTVVAERDMTRAELESEFGPGVLVFFAVDSSGVMTIDSPEVMSPILQGTRIIGLFPRSSEPLAPRPGRLSVIERIH